MAGSEEARAGIGAGGAPVVEDVASASTRRARARVADQALAEFMQRAARSPRAPGGAGAADLGRRGQQ